MLHTVVELYVRHTRGGGGHIDAGLHQGGYVCSVRLYPSLCDVSGRLTMALRVPASVCFFTSSSHCRAMDWGEMMRVVLASMGYKGERNQRSTKIHWHY